MWDRAYGNNLYVLFFLPFWKKWLKNYWHFVTGKTAKSILISCGATLFLGGKEKDTLKDLAEILGKETIDLYNTSDTRGTGQSYGLNYQKTGKKLMSQDEIAVMDGSKCIMQLNFWTLWPEVVLQLNMELMTWELF